MRWIVSVTLALATLPWTAGPAGAQAALPVREGGAEPVRYLDYFVSRLRPAQGAGLDAVGGRVMWSLAPLAEPGWRASLERVALGGYLAHVPPEDVRDAEAWRYGVQTDLSLAARPFEGRIDPLLSVAVGAVRVRNPGALIDPAGGMQAGLEPNGPPPLLALPVLLPPRTATDLSLAPGLGARVQLLPGVALRGDARQVLDFRDQGVHHHLEFSGALSVQTG